MRQEQFKMERQGLIKVGDVVEISEFQSYMNLQLHHRTGCWQCPDVTKTPNELNPKLA